MSILPPNAMSILPRRMGGQVVLFAVFYCLLMYVLLTVGRAAGVSSVVWPTNALALGIYMLFRRSDFLPFTFAVIGGAFVVHLVLGDALSYSVACAVGSGLTFGLVGWGCTHFGMASARTLSVRMVIGLAGVAIFATIPGALVGAATLAVTTGGDAGQYFLRWWLPEMASIVLLLPPFALWRNADDWPEPEEMAPGARAGPLHGANLGETVAASAALAASGGVAVAVGDPLLLNLGAIVLLWFAFRLGVFQTAAAASLFSVAMVIGASAGAWHFGDDRLVGLLRLQGVMALDLLPALFVAAVIAQRERLRRRLQEDERRLSFALEAANDGIWDLHVPTGSLFLSPQAHRMLGYEPGEIAPAIAEVHRLIHPEDLHNCVLGFLDGEGAHTDAYEREFRTRHKSGEWIWLHERGKIVERDAGRRAIRVVGTVTDITRRKQLEEELAHAAKALNALNNGMVRLILRALSEFEAQDHIRAVVVTAEGGKSFCAGGDLKEIYHLARQDRDLAVRIWSEEYILNARIASCSKPWVCLVDGLCMGAGMAMAVHGRSAVLSESALLSMPEVRVGFYPDVGVTFRLCRLPDRLGFYFAITGEPIPPSHAVEFGLARAVVPKSLHAELAAEIARGGDPHAQIARFALPMESPDLAKLSAFCGEVFSAPT